MSYEFLPNADFSIGKKNKYDIREPMSKKFIKASRKLPMRICLYEIKKKFIDFKI